MIMAVVTLLLIILRHCLVRAGVPPPIHSVRSHRTSVNDHEMATLPEPLICTRPPLTVCVPSYVPFGSSLSTVLTITTLTLLDVRYDADTPALSFDTLKSNAVVPKTVIGEAPEVSIGDARRALEAADVSVDQVYRTPW